MKSSVVILTFLIISVITRAQCQVDDDDKSYFELGQSYDDDSTSYINIGKRTDLRKINHNEIELRYVALNSPVTFIKIEVNANVKTFQFAYLNESSCIIRLYGLKSSDQIVTATAKIYGPGGHINSETGNFEYNVVNKTMLLQKVKEGTELVSHSTNKTNDRNEDNRSVPASRRTNYWRNYDADLYAANASFLSKMTMTFLCFVVVVILNFTKLF